MSIDAHIFKTCSLCLFLPRVTYTYLKNTVHVVLLKEITKSYEHFRLSSWSLRHASCTEFFPHFPQISFLQRKHRSVVLFLQHLIEHVQCTLGSGDPRWSTSLDSPVFAAW